MSRPTLFFATLWLAVACCVWAGSIAFSIINGQPVTIRGTTVEALVYAIWVPLVPLIAALGRRTRSIPIHFGAAVAFSFVNLVAHKLLCCGFLSDDWLACATYYRFEPWLVRWLFLNSFVYAATASGIWLLDTRDGIRRGDLLLSHKQRELASAELQIVHGQIPPAYLTSLFDAIAARLTWSAAAPGGAVDQSAPDHDAAEGGGGPREAEQMITKVADFLRASVSAIRATEITVADDLALLGAWAEVESARRSAPVVAMVEVGSRARAAPLGAPMIQPLAARLAPEGAALIRVTSSVHDDALAVRVDCSNGRTETILL